VGAHTAGHGGGTLEDASGNQVVVTDESALCPVSISDATSSGVAVTATVTGASGSMSYTGGYEYIVDSTLWKTDWISQDPVSGETTEIYKAQLFRNSSFAGEYPLVMACTDLPDLDYKDITRSALTMRAKYSINSDSSQHVFSLTTTAPDGLIFWDADTYNFEVDKYFTGFTTGSWTEAEINADTIKMTDGDDSPHARDYMSIAAIRHVVDFHAYPEARIYKFQLRVVGTAGPKPGVSQFNITVDGATGTGKRTSKLVVSQTDFQRADAATLVDVLSAASGTAPTAGMTQRWDTCKFFGKQYFTNGIDTPYEYPDASNEVIDLTGSPPDGFTCASYAGRLFFGCTTETGTVFPDRVRWSAVEGATTWTGAGTGYIDLNDTDGRVVKLLPLGGILVAYKENSLYNLHATGDANDPIVKQLISPGIGAVAMGTVLSVVARDGLPAHIFLGQGRGGYNVYMYTGNLLTPIGDDIKEELRDNLNASQAKNAFAIVDQKRNQYMFFVAYAGETFPHRCWLYDIDTGAWKHWKTGEITCAGHLKGTETDDDIEEWFMYFGLNNSLSRWPDPDLNADEDSVNVRMTAESGDWAVERHKYATLYRLHIHYYDKGFTPLEVYTSNDGGDTWSDKVTVWIGQSDGSADDSLRVAYADLMETGKRFRMRVVHDADAAIKISELIMEVEEQGWIY
jgi:hypothetical protein